MSKPVFKLCVGNTLPAIPDGDLLKGWLPGTIVNFVYSTENKYPHICLASAMTDVCGVGGFLINGSAEFLNGFDRMFANDNESSGLWTPDEMVQLAKPDENTVQTFDSNSQLEKLGKGLVAVNFDGGLFKFYVYEKYDNDYIESNGETGGEIDWQSKIGTLFGCSPRSLFTSIDNNVCVEPMEYRVGGIFSDENGKYILAVRR